MRSPEEDRIIKDGGYYDKNNRWNAVIEHENNYYRKRVEVIVLNSEGQLYARIYHAENRCRFPGGSVDKCLPNEDQAFNECKEEANIIIKNIKYTGVEYYHKYDFPFTGFPNLFGSYNIVYIAEFDKYYDGYVDKIDRDNDMLYNGRFYSYDYLKDYMSSSQLRAYHTFINKPENDKTFYYPYYTPYQMDQLGVYQKDPADNYYGVKASTDNKVWFETYSKYNNPGKNYKKKLLELYYEYIKSPDDLSIKQSLIEFGWNPETNAFNNKILYSISESTRLILNK